MSGAKSNLVIPIPHRNNKVQRFNFKLFPWTCHSSQRLSSALKLATSNEEADKKKRGSQIALFYKTITYEFDILQSMK